MANAFYPSAKAAFLKGDIDLELDDIRVILVDLADYTYSGSHDFLNDVPAAARVAVSGNLSSKVVELDGTTARFDADDVTFSSVTGDQFEAYIVYKHTGTESTSALIYFADTGVTGLPLTPNGGNIIMQFHATNKIFSLA